VNAHVGKNVIDVGLLNDLIDYKNNFKLNDSAQEVYTQYKNNKLGSKVEVKQKDEFDFETEEVVVKQDTVFDLFMHRINSINMDSIGS